MKFRMETNKVNDRKKQSRLRKLKAEANAVSHRRRQRIRQLETQKLEKLAERIEQHEGGQQMFAAVKALKDIETARVPMIVHDSNGHVVHDKKETATQIADHFQHSGRN